MSEDFILEGKPPRALPGNCRSLVVDKPRAATVWAQVAELLAKHPRVDLYLGPSHRDLERLAGLRRLRLDGLRAAGPLPSLTELAVANTSAPTAESFRPLVGRLRRLVVGLKSARKNQAVRDLLGELPQFDPWDEP